MDKVIDKIYELYFLNCVPKLIAQTNSLNKANMLINEFPIKYSSDGRPKVLIHSSTFVEQILNGVLISQSLDSSNYHQIIAEYQKYAAKYEVGRILAVDLMREAIEKFDSRI